MTAAIHLQGHDAPTLMAYVYEFQQAVEKSGAGPP